MHQRIHEKEPKKEAKREAKRKKPQTVEASTGIVTTEKNWAQNEAALHSWKDKWREPAYLWPGKKHKQSHRKHAEQCNPAGSEDRELAKGYPLTLTALWNTAGNATSKGLTKQNSTFREQSSNMCSSQELQPVEHCIHSSRMVSGILGARTGCRF